MTSEEFTNGHPALAHFWHPVALSSEVGREPAAGRLGGRGWALARFSGGIAAFADACPHRRARLSAGQITDGTLQCMYHGPGMADAEQAESAAKYEMSIFDEDLELQ